MRNGPSIPAVIAALGILALGCSSTTSGGLGGSSAKGGASGSGGSSTGGSSGNQNGGAGGNGTGGSASGGSGGTSTQTGGSTSVLGGSGGATVAPGGAGGNGSGSGGTVAKGGTNGGGAGGGSGGVNSGGAGASGAGGTSATCTSTASGTAANTLAVDVDSAQMPVGKEIFGVLMERLGRDIKGGLYVGTQSAIPNTAGLRNDIVDGLKEIGIGAIEWPGGTAANTYDWTKTNPSTDMGTDLFMQFLAQVGATPILVGRYADGSASSNLQWLTYIHKNADHPDWYIPYFKVGNEVWWAGDSEASYEPKFLSNYDALSPPINGKKTTLVISTGEKSINSSGQAIEDLVWLDTAVKNLGSKIGGVEIHEYVYRPLDIPNIGFSDDQYYDVMHSSNQGRMAPDLEDIIAVLDKYDPDKRIKIIEDEWGVWLKSFDGSDTWFEQGTLMHGLAAAETLHVFMKRADRIGMAGLAQAVNVLHALFLTRSSDGAMVKTPTFYVWKMMLPHHTSGAKWAPNTLVSEKITGNNTTFPVLSSGATVDSSGHVNISLVNVDLTKTRSIQITLNSSRGGYSVSSAQVLTGAAKDTYNDFGKAEQINAQDLPGKSYTICGKTLTIDLPAKSVVMLVLTPQ